MLLNQKVLWINILEIKGKSKIKVLVEMKKI